MKERERERRINGSENKLGRGTPRHTKKTQGGGTGMKGYERELKKRKKKRKQGEDRGKDERGLQILLQGGRIPEES